MKVLVLTTLGLITFSMVVAISQVMQSKDFRKTTENAIDSLTGKMAHIAGILQAKYITQKHGNKAAPGDRELTNEEILHAQNLLQTKFYERDIQWPQNDTEYNEIDTMLKFKPIADNLPMPLSDFFQIYHMNKVFKSLDSNKNNPFYPLHPLRIDEVPLPDDIGEYEEYYNYENDYPEQVTNQDALLKELPTDLTEDRSEIDPLLDTDYSANKLVETRHYFPAELRNINLDNGKPTQNTVTDSSPLFDKNKSTATQNTMLSQESITKSRQNYPFDNMKEYGILIRPYFFNENTAKKTEFDIQHSKGDNMFEMGTSTKANDLKFLFENKRGDSEKIGVPAFHPWGGKRSENDMSSEILYKRSAAAKIKNEKEKFYSWGGKRDRMTSYLIPSHLQTKGYRIPRSQVRKVEIPKRVTFHSWGGKRAKPDTAVGGSGPEASKVPFSPWGGKRYSSDVIVEREQPAAQPMDLIK